MCSLYSQVFVFSCYTLQQLSILKWTILTIFSPGNTYHSCCSCVCTHSAPFCFSSLSAVALLALGFMIVAFCGRVMLIESLRFEALRFVGRLMDSLSPCCRGLWAIKGSGTVMSALHGEKWLSVLRKQSFRSAVTFDISASTVYWQNLDSNLFYSYSVTSALWITTQTSHLLLPVLLQWDSSQWTWMHWAKL